MERWQVKVGAGPLERLAASEFNPYQERNCGRGYKNGWLTTEKATLSVAILIYRSLSGAPIGRSYMPRLFESGARAQLRSRPLRVRFQAWFCSCGWGTLVRSRGWLEFEEWDLS
jgi:hypothetical protein